MLGFNALSETPLSALPDAGGSVAVTVTPGTGSLTLTGFAPTVTATDGTTHVTVTPGTGALVITGYAPTVTTGSETEDGDDDGGHGGRAGHGFSKLTRREIERYRRLRDEQERGVRKHADELVGFAPPDAPDAPTPQPEPVVRAPAVNPLGIAQIAPVDVGAAPIFGPGYAEQQAELLRLEIERAAQMQAVALAEAELARAEAEQLAHRMRDEEDVLVLLLAA